MGAEEGDGAGEGAAGAEVGHVAEGEPLQFLVLLQWAVLEPGLELCGLEEAAMWAEGASSSRVSESLIPVVLEPLARLLEAYVSV